MKIWFIWDIKRFLLHTLAGLVFYATALIIPPLTFGVIFLFIVYELKEDLHLKDGAYIDIQGAFGGVIIMLILHILYLKGWLFFWHN